MQLAMLMVVLTAVMMMTIRALRLGRWHQSQERRQTMPAMTESAEAADPRAGRAAAAQSREGAKTAANP